MLMVGGGGGLYQEKIVYCSFFWAEAKPHKLQKTKKN